MFVFNNIKFSFQRKIIFPIIKKRVFVSVKLRDVDFSKYVFRERKREREREVAKEHAQTLTIQQASVINLIEL